MTKAITPSGSFIGCRVRSKVDFVGVPAGTEGVIDEGYSYGIEKHGLMVAWDLPDHPLPKGYAYWDGKPAIQTGILRDGFQQEELGFLELVGCENPIDKKT